MIFKKNSYVAPAAKTVEVKTQAIICGSESQAASNITEMTEGDDNW